MPLKDFGPVAEKLAPGDTVVVMGLRGAGKSTMALHLRRELPCANILPDTLSYDKTLARHFCDNKGRVNIVEAQYLCLPRETPIAFVFFMGQASNLMGLDRRLHEQQGESPQYIASVLEAMRGLEEYESLVICMRSGDMFKYRCPAPAMSPILKEL